MTSLGYLKLCICHVMNLFWYQNHNSINIVESEMWLHHILLFGGSKNGGSHYKRIFLINVGLQVYEAYESPLLEIKKSKRILKVLDFDSTNINCGKPLTRTFLLEALIAFCKFSTLNKLSINTKRAKNRVPRQKSPN